MKPNQTLTWFALSARSIHRIRRAVHKMFLAPAQKRFGCVQALGVLGAVVRAQRALVLERATVATWLTAGRGRCVQMAVEALAKEGATFTAFQTTGLRGAVVTLGCAGAFG